MQQAYDDVVQERNDLRQQLNKTLQQLGRVLGEHENEMERNLCRQFEEDGFCEKRRCRFVHRYEYTEVDS